jgi:hypothetical protein
MKTATLLTIGLVALLGTAPVWAGQTAPAAASGYVDESQPDPAPLKMRGVEGKVHGLGGDAMARATVSLFTELEHALVATVVTDRDGKFRFAKVDKGLYRVVARVEGLCPANIPIKVESSLVAHREIEITMQPKDIDRCSYGVAKK